jgi:hypothetical protein
MISTSAFTPTPPRSSASRIAPSLTESLTLSSPSGCSPRRRNSCHVATPAPTKNCSGLSGSAAIGYGQPGAQCDVTDVRGHPVAPMLMTHVGGQLVTQHLGCSGNGPQLCRVVGAAGGEALAVGAERHTEHSNAVPPPAQTPRPRVTFSDYIGPKGPRPEGALARNVNASDRCQTNRNDHVRQD